MEAMAMIGQTEDNPSDQRGGSCGSSILWEKLSNSEAEDKIVELNLMGGTASIGSTDGSTCRRYYKLVTERELKTTIEMDKLGICPRLLEHHRTQSVGTGGELSFVIVLERYPMNLYQYFTHSEPSVADKREALERADKLLTVMHKYGWVHLDADATNFVYDAKTQVIKLIDFETARRIPSIGTVGADAVEKVDGVKEDAVGSVDLSLRMSKQWVKLGLTDHDSLQDFDREMLNRVAVQDAKHVVNNSNYDEKKRTIRKVVSNRELKMTILADEMGICPKLLGYHPVGLTDRMFVMQSERYPIDLDDYHVECRSEEFNRVLGKAKALLDKLHSKGYVHLDAVRRNFVYDPTTILTDGSGGDVKMIDFESMIPIPPPSEKCEIKMGTCWGNSDPLTTFGSIRFDEFWTQVGCKPDATFQDFDHACLLYTH